MNEKLSLPSVSHLGTVKFSSLATCLCPNNGIVEGGLSVNVVDSEGGRRGLFELADVLVDAAAIGTPAVDGYKS
jgi:hypothetical protein